MDAAVYVSVHDRGSINVCQQLDSVSHSQINKNQQFKLLFNDFCFCFFLICRKYLLCVCKTE